MNRTSLCLLAVLLTSAMTLSALAADTLDRTVLPIQEPQRLPITTFDARDVKAPPRFEVTAPAGAPNVWSPPDPLIEIGVHDS